ncbi:MAG: hypothetical protein OES57_17905, partial [Acidimicrobiia bacterium]|nr:hypothetical protein [Acidimicrobiia bacterium]
DADGQVNANAAASAALAVAALGDGETLQRLAKSMRSANVTYVDSFTLLLAEGLLAAREGDPAKARELFARSRELLAPTGDVLSQALGALAEATALEAVRDEAAVPVTELAEQRLDAIGIDALGWRTAFRVAAGL